MLKLQESTLGFQIIDITTLSYLYFAFILPVNYYVI